MNLATITSIFTTLQAILDAVVKYGPSVIAGFESIVKDLELAWKSATSGKPLTPEEQQAIDDNLEQANQALAAAVAAAEAEDAALSQPAAPTTNG